MDNQNINNYLSANHNPQTAAAQYLQRASPVHSNNASALQQPSSARPQLSLPTSYNDFFAANNWSHGAHTLSAAAALSRPSSTLASAASALQHSQPQQQQQQPWTQGHDLPVSTASQPPSSLQHSRSSQQSTHNASKPNKSRDAQQGQLDPSHQRHTPTPHQQQQQPISQFHSASNQVLPTISPRPAGVISQPPSTAAVSASLVGETQHQAYGYAPNAKPQQFSQQPTYGHAGQHPGYGIQYPQINNAVQSTQTAPSYSVTRTAPLLASRPASLQQQVHQVLSNVPIPEILSSNPRFRVIDTKKLCEKTNSKLISPLLAVGQDTIDLSHAKVTQLPRFDARKNLLELRQLIGHDPDLKLKIEKHDTKVRSKFASIVASTSPKSSGTLALKSVPSSSSSSEDETSCATDSSEDDLEIEEKSPLPASRPTDPFKAAEYDVVKAVWHARSTYIENNVLLQRVAQFSDLFSKLRDRWKVSNDALKEAEQGQSTSQISSLSSKVNQNRKIVETALRAAVMHGHPHILSMLSENKRLIAGMYGLLSDRINKKAYDDSLSIFALRFLKQMTNLTTETLESTKLTKALPYFVKRGPDNVKALAQKIIDSAAENSKKEGKAAAASKATSKPATPAGTNAPPNFAKSNIKAVGDETVPATLATPNALKRPRVLEPLANQPAKRQAVSANGSKVATPAASSVVKRPLTTIGSKSSATPSTVAKSKVAAKPAVTSAAAKKASPMAAKPAPAIRGPESAKSGFSFGGMMQNILKPVVVEVKEVAEEPVSTETPEEKSKRLRKEGRRRLRVTWKPDHDLCAIKIFSHDPDEETGHDASSVRDVTDVGNEGRMFKQLHKDHMDIVDVELEEEEKEESFSGHDWSPPAQIDFSDLVDPDVDWNKIYQPFAKGELLVDSTEREIQMAREAATLMVVYITRDDIPSRPQSPVESQADNIVASASFGAPDERTKQREQALMAPPAIDMDAIARILGSTNGATAAPIPIEQPIQQVPQPPIAQFSQQDILAALQSLTNPSVVPASGVPTASTINDTISQPPAPDLHNYAMNPLALAGLLGNAPFPPPPPNVPQAPPPVDFATLLSQFQNANGPAPPLPVMAPPVPLPTLPAGISNVADLWAQLGLAQPPPAAGSFPSLAANGQPDNNTFNGQYENAERKRYRDETEEDDSGGDQWSKRANSGTAGVNGWDAQHKAKWSYEDNSKKFTLPCKFWPIGKCTKGASCTYRHDV